jgi:predicted enzyme related to lactoylglutathione lyase
MHRSRLVGFIIDCQTGDVAQAAKFWSQALGMPAREAEYPRYIKLDEGARDLFIEVQAVEHESRVHLDIESDDVPAEVARLQQLGAIKLPQTHQGTWVVMEAPTGQRFCVVRTRHDLTVAPGANAWPDLRGE